MKEWYKTKPDILGFYCCITNDLEIAAKLSAIFTSEDCYFPVIDPPRIRRLDSTNETIRRMNLLARLRPLRVILGKLTTEEKLALVGSIPLKKIDNIENPEELESIIDELRTELHISGVVECRPDQVALGLLLAKYQKKFIKINHSANDVDEEEIKKYASGDHLVILDDLTGINQVIAANYAYMLKGGLRILPHSSEDENQSIFEDIMDENSSTYSQRGERAKRSVMSHQYKLDEKITIKEVEEKFITFITSGFPYGYFFPDTPSTHLFSTPDLSLSVLQGLIGAYRPTNIALTVDPGHFRKSETQAVNDSLTKLGVYVKKLADSEATVYNMGVHMEVYPYDLLFICSHAGQSDGQEFTIEIKDREGNPHSVVIEVADGFGLTGEGSGVDSIVEVKSHYGFVSMDGFDWSDPSRPRPAGFMESFIQNPDRGHWKILSKRSVPTVKRAMILKMKDGNLIAMMHNVAGHESPFIFNNACITFNEFSERFMFAGARAYIGTLVSIDNQYAIKFATDFFSNLDPEKPIPLHLWETQKKLNSKPQSYNYMHVGVFHTFINPPDQETKHYLREKLEYYIEKYSKKFTESPEFAGSIRNYLKLLNEEYKKIKV